MTKKTLKYFLTPSLNIASNLSTILLIQKVLIIKNKNVLELKGKMQNILLPTTFTVGIELKGECINQIALFFEFMNIWKTVDCTVSSDFHEREVRIWKILFSSLTLKSTRMAVFGA